MQTRLANVVIAVILRNGTFVSFSKLSGRGIDGFFPDVNSRSHRTLAHTVHPAISGSRAVRSFQPDSRHGDMVGASGPGDYGGTSYPGFTIGRRAGAGKNQSTREHGVLCSKCHRPVRPRG